MNPFGITYNPAHFCDREKETRQLKSNIDNGLNTLMHSPRRLGKTALIHHLFYNLEKEKQYDTLYIDLFSTRDMNGLITLLAEKTLKKYHSKNFFQGVKQILKGISPVVTFSPDGTPSLSLNLQQTQQKQTLDEIFDFLEVQKKKVVIAFDEFQEVTTYPEKAEAILRSFIQQLNQVKFIFSGSSNHLLQEMFYSAKRPFYQSSEVLVLEKIDKKAYSSFIGKTFEEHAKKIDQDAVDLILSFSETYTYYTQICCNQCFSKTENELTANETISILKEYLESRKADYLQLFSLLPENQKKVAIAIAKEGVVKQPTAIDFIMKYKLPTGSSTLQAVKSLSEKEILYYYQGKYSVYDVFFKQFLSTYY